MQEDKGREGGQGRQGRQMPNAQCPMPHAQCPIINKCNNIAIKTFYRLDKPEESR
ncbi:hypothetical protein H6G08_06705 [Calothrix anomala FACHB-343]|uniref:Uncharacterized protein n=1 Tax=Calothrix anomala FACHB-343 TaxID=2692894 RepID=A0ABR8AQ61_9CYAN|nr:hypothetical protein [Calothrix anomala FACHB-343]